MLTSNTAPVYTFLILYYESGSEPLDHFLQSLIQIYRKIAK